MTTFLDLATVNRPADRVVGCATDGLFKRFILPNVVKFGRPIPMPPHPWQKERPMPGQQKLFQYAILYHPSEKEIKDGAATKILVPPTDFFLADSQEQVFAMALRVVPEEYMGDKFSRVEVAVRPF